MMLINTVNGNIVAINVEEMLDEMMGKAIGIDNIRQISKELVEEYRDIDFHEIRDVAKSLIIGLIERGNSMATTFDKVSKYVATMM